MSGNLEYKEIERRMDGAITSLKNDLSGLRTGRASPSLLDPVIVEAYGQSMPINQVATVTAGDARMIGVQVWDKSMVGAVDRAIREAGLGLNPIVDGTNLRIPLPELNEERRKELVKIAHQYCEAAKVAVRHVRRDGMDALKKAEKDGDLGQDEARARSEKVQKLTDEKISQVDEITAQKQKEIMQV